MSQKPHFEHDGPDMERRIVLKSLGAAGIAGIGLACGIAPPAFADDAPDWPQKAFKEKSEEAALNALYGKTAEMSDKIKLELPEIAENGAVVPVTVATELPNVTSLAILVPENPFTLAASYRLPEGTMPAISCRIKMAKTSMVVAIVESEGKLYRTTKEVKVTLGGCGG
jgi:sulfur-oxidizing protein SoxY